MGFFMPLMGPASTGKDRCQENTQMIALETDILDSLPSAVLAVDNENRILFLNRALAAQLGIDREHWLGRPAGELAERMLPSLGSPDLFHSYAEWAADPESQNSQPVIWKSGEQALHLREDSAPLRDAAGTVAGRLFAYHDLSREHEIDRHKSEFLAVATHELRTPLTSIKGSVDLILSGFVGEIDPETRELLELAQSSCERLTRLINNILDLAKIEAGQLKLNPFAVDLRELAGRALRNAKGLADPRGIVLELDAPADLPLVTADPDRIEQVVTNLLSNAIKFSPDQGRVQVVVGGADGWAECSVADQGCGIAPEDFGKIFGRFQQVGSGASKKGTGLGLAISRALVLEHNGKIWVESRLGEGARFIFRLPVSPPAPA
jgi:signal transduction histidine kinase